MRFKHSVPVDFAEERARLGTVRALARHYHVGMHAVRRWLDETNSPSLRELEGWKLKRPHCTVCARPLQYHSRTSLCIKHYNEKRKVIADERARSTKTKYFLADIIGHTAAAFGISKELLTGNSRRRAHVRPRQVAFYLGKHMTALSLTDIGRRMGKDHSTVSHGADVIARLIRDDRELRAVVSSAIRSIKGLGDNPPAEPIRLACMGHKYKRAEPPRPVLHFSDPTIPDDDMELLSLAVRNHYAAGRDCLEVY